MNFVKQYNSNYLFYYLRAVHVSQFVFVKSLVSTGTMNNWYTGICRWLSWIFCGLFAVLDPGLEDWWSLKVKFYWTPNWSDPSHWHPVRFLCIDKFCWLWSLTLQPDVSQSCNNFYCMAWAFKLARLSTMDRSEPLQNDQEHFFSDIFLNFYNIIKNTI